MGVFKTVSKRWEIVFLSVIVLLLISLFILPTAKKEDYQMVLSARPTNGEFSVGEKFTVYIYLSGKDSEKVTVADIGLNYNKDNLRLTSIHPGGFFKEPLVVKWDIEQALFSLATNPAAGDISVATIRPEAPVLKLEFLAIKEDSKTAVSFDSESLVYVSKKGGIYPKPFSGYYEINTAHE